MIPGRIPAALSLALLISGCNQLLNSVPGSGKPATENRNVSGFSSVELEGSGDLHIEQTGTESLSITADDNLLQYLTSDVSGGRLRLAARNGINFSASGPVVYKLTVKSLDGISLSGSGTVDGKALTSDSMKIDLSGSGDITATGGANKVEVMLSGSGNIHGDGYKGKDVRVELDGSGNATVAASDKLDVSINGSGVVEYIGDPKVTTSNNGSGSVRQKR
jgi:hypothetical protein